MKKFVIENTQDCELLWSNLYGWVGQNGNSFDVFNFHEMQNFDLPIKGKWVEWVDYSTMTI